MGFRRGSHASRDLGRCESGWLEWDSGDCVGYPQDYGGLAGSGRRGVGWRAANFRCVSSYFHDDFVVLISFWGFFAKCGCGDR